MAIDWDVIDKQKFNVFFKKKNKAFSAVSILAIYAKMGGLNIENN